MTTSTDLLSYLETDLRTLRDDLGLIERLLGPTLQFFQGAAASDTFHVPYETRTMPLAHATSKLSHATNLMVAHALQLLAGVHGETLLLPRSDGPLKRAQIPQASQIEQARSNVRSTVLKDLASTNKLLSSTYRENSTLVACWLVELLLSGDNASEVGQHAPLLAAVIASEDLTSQEPRKPDTVAPGESTVIHDRAFCRLRRFQCVLLLRTLRKKYVLDGSLPELPANLGMSYGNRFLSSLHDHLSFYRIPDSRFDPAELAFNLEGALLAATLGGPQIERATVDTALDVLCQCQNTSSHWRPTRPFVVDSRGLVLFPVSVEVSNSILRSLELLERQRLNLTPDRRAKLAAALSQYLHWLEARVVRIGTDVLGWHSEHVNDQTLAHPWETSQVLLFLGRLHVALERMIAEDALAVAAVSRETPTDKGKLKSSVTTLGEAYDASQIIQRAFVDPRLTTPSTAARLPFSMLLYGPPGTGKTRMAKLVASQLGMSLLSLSVSDFLASGPSVERRAKALFDVLMYQSNTVVLFDELDHLLLDRDSRIYRHLDTVFQFVTPGMLTKLQALRTAERLIFIIATNFEDRIDPAIKRTGRVDRAVLVLPPDIDYRKELIHSNMTTKPDGTAMGLLASASNFLTWGDITKLCPPNCTRSVEDLRQLFEDEARGASLASYGRLFAPDENGKSPTLGLHTVSEFLGMLALHLQCEATASRDALAETMSFDKSGFTNFFKLPSVKKEVQYLSALKDGLGKARPHADGLKKMLAV